ncbi:beta-lactamase family protein [Pelagibacteraceae bacterium]|nr:beta-lactamase family protein [Pelagibacteraceae bacterium]
MNEIKESFYKHIENGICNGAEYIINYNGKIYQEVIGFKDLEKKIKLPKNLHYRIWSMTKPIVSLAAMQLVEKNFLSLDDTIDKYFPSLNKIKILNKNSKNINDTYLSNKIPTIRDLLLHTAGFTYNTSNNIIAEEYEKRKIFHSGETSLEQEVYNILQIPLLFEPGTEWHYSVSIDILARIIEIITKESLINTLNENIFSLLQMKNTNFYINKEDNINLANTFEFSRDTQTLKNLNPAARKLVNYWYPANNTTYARGGHGLFSTAEDYLQFSNMLFDGKNFKGKELIKSETLNQMRVNSIDPSLFPLEITSINTIKDKKYINDLEGYGWGLGFRVLMNKTKHNPYGAIGEFGWSGYASTYFMVDPVNRISAVLMMQIIDGERILKQDFYNNIFKNLKEI